MGSTSALILNAGKFFESRHNYLYFSFLSFSNLSLVFRLPGLTESAENSSVSKNFEINFQCHFLSELKEIHNLHIIGSRQTVEMQHSLQQRRAFQEG